jgi:hypothetical protein
MTQPEFHHHPENSPCHAPPGFIAPITHHLLLHPDFSLGGQISTPRASNKAVRRGAAGDGRWSPPTEYDNTIN